LIEKLCANKLRRVSAPLKFKSMTICSLLL